jgi:hypothetical protein
MYDNITLTKNHVEKIVTSSVIAVLLTMALLLLSGSTTTTILNQNSDGIKWTKTN